ncbi:MAG: hypothetical protein B1H04_05750, partial [Planctomycetales bacterium 4484_123]
MGRIVTRLDAVRRRHLLVQLALAATGMVTLVLATLLMLGTVGFWRGQPPSALRWALLVMTLTVWLAGAVWFALVPLRRRLNYAQAARLVEEQLGGLRNGLINALQLSTDPHQASPAMVQKAIEETIRRCARAPLSEAVRLDALKRWSLGAAVVAAAAVGFVIFFGPQLSRGLAAVFRPGAYVPTAGTVKLLSIKPGDTTIFAGENLTVVAKVHNPQRRRLRAWVEIAGRDDGPPASASADRSTFSCALGKVEQSFKYAVHVGDSRFPAEKPYYTVSVLQRVEVEGLDLAYSYPAYTGLAEKEVLNAAGPIEAPLGTMVRVRLRLSAPVPGAVLETRSGRRLKMRPDSAGKSYATVLHVTCEDAYRVVLTDSVGRRLQQLPDTSAGIVSGGGELEGLYPIRPVPDAAPRIEFIEPNRDVSVPVGGKLLTRLRASDDYGLASVKFFLGRERQGQNNRPTQAADARMVHSFAEVRGKQAVELTYTVDIGNDCREGDVLVYYAAATDGRNLGRLGGPQRAESPIFKILIQDAAKVAAERAKRYEQLRRRLLAILEAQERQRVNTEIAARKHSDMVQVRRTGRQIVAGQQAIKTDMLDVVDHFPFTPEMLTVQQALALLANNEAALAITQARVVAGLSETAERTKACAALAGTQEKIIQSLQTLLAILPSLQREAAEAKKPSAGEDVPPEAREKLTALKTQLERFIEEQRKIIEASERLTKKAVDDFTPEDEKLLKDLQLAQDKWEKFLNEKFTDFSKLAQQDFSKPSLLKELISVKTDVTMAKDALKKKATEIATAIEDNGIENAKTLTANIEKWLPDEPDRIKWN